MRRFRGSIAFAVLGLAVGAAAGWAAGGLAAALDALWIVAVLGVLEVSLSFDNAVVNASVLRGMDAAWRRRFLTWGVVLAVFGTRIVFPLAIVAIAGGVGPIEAVRLALGEPAAYERIVTSAHVAISGFGGAFLLMVALGFFVDQEKTEHWIGPVERPLAFLARVPGLAPAAALAAVLGASRLLPTGEAETYLAAGALGVVADLAVHALSALLGRARPGGARSGLAAFVYLEVLDASFSLDGVIGAFALTDDLIVMALGLSVGAVFVRSLTMLMVDQETLGQYRYLEHGAFWAIGALAAIMLAAPVVEVPQAATGLVGAALIGAAFLSSRRGR